RHSATDDPCVPATTCSDPARQIAPDFADPADARTAATASESIDVRSIGSGDESWGNCSDPIEIKELDFQAVRLSGQTRLIVVPSFAGQREGLRAPFAGATPDHPRAPQHTRS